MKFHYRVRGIIIVEGKVLLAHQKGAGNTFLPGGHIESGEGAEAALARELFEEIGRNAIIGKFVGAVEHVFPEGEPSNHEINLVFEADVSGLVITTAPQSLEDHIEFLWCMLTTQALQRHNLQPSPLIACLSNWGRRWGGYWGTTI